MPISPVYTAKTGFGLAKKEEEKEAQKIEWVFNRYNTVALKHKLPVIRKITDTRKRKLKARIQDFPAPDIWDELFSALAKSAPYLKSEAWFNFDFVIKSTENFEKVLNQWMRWKKKSPKGTAPEEPSYLSNMRLPARST